MDQAHGQSDGQWLLDERAELKRQQQLLEYERQEFLRAKAYEEKRLEEEKRLFNTEWEMLEEGWRLLAAERARLEREFSVHLDSDEMDFVVIGDVSVSLLFCGVKTMRSLKRRYRDLIKIFHPDNAAGDTMVIQQINAEYEALKKKFEMPRSRIFQD